MSWASSRLLLLAAALQAGCLSSDWIALDGDGDGWSPAQGDCDDTDAAVHPGALEVWYDGLDSDCSSAGAPDDDFDADGDGYAAPDPSDGSLGGDCWDDPLVAHPGVVPGQGWSPLTAAEVNPGATERWYDGVDSDCGGDDDFDADGDGHAADDQLQADGATGGDCDDADAALNPDAAETWYDGVDQDCDGNDDDADGDGYAVDAECDDADPDRYPDGAADDWYDCVDSDCDGNDGDRDGDGYVPDDYAATCDWTQFSAHAAAGDCWDDPDAIAVTPAPGYPAPDPADVYPGAADDWYDGVDSDCGGDDDFDADADGHAADDRLQADGALGGDCDDGAPAVNPDAEEDCGTAYDDDCDGQTNSEAAIGCVDRYPDDDGDGYGEDGDPARCYCDPGYGIYTAAATGDCDDGEPSVNPAATEICNEVDDDCDGDVDPPTAVGASEWYADADADTYGDAADSQTACDQPADHVADATDCDDDDAASHPGGTETCDGAADEDCDGDVDESDAVDAATWHRDGDSDGHGDAGISVVDCDQPAGFIDDAAIAAGGPGDCDDADADSYPGGTEVCTTGGSGADEDCDGDVDESGAIGASAWYADLDGDGYGDAAVSEQRCGAPTDYVVDDTDCDDGDADTYPGADEYCDGHDDDCDGDADESGALDTFTWRPDGDGDGYGDSDDGNATRACDQPDGHLLNAGDCDDGDDSVNPDADEICATDADAADEDCDGAVDEGFTLVDWYADGDGDGYGDPEQSLGACDQPSGYAADDATTGGWDCDDGDDRVNPGAVESVDAADQDCDEYADEGFVAAGDLVIAELMVTLADESGQWFELYNASTRTIALDGWEIAWGAGAFFVPPEADLQVASGARLVLCRADDAPATDGVDCDYVYGSDPGWAPSIYGDPSADAPLAADDALTLWMGALSIDAVGYDTNFSVGSEATSAQSGSLDATTNDDDSDWCAASTLYNADHYGTPGAATDCGP